MMDQRDRLLWRDELLKAWTASKRPVDPSGWEVKKRGEEEKLYIIRYIDTYIYIHIMCINNIIYINRCQCNYQ